MAIRNFFIRGHIEGRKSEITGGPLSKSGGFVLEIWQRLKGQKKRMLQVGGSSDGSQTTLYVLDSKNDVVFKYTGDR